VLHSLLLHQQLRLPDAHGFALQLRVVVVELVKLVGHRKHLFQQAADTQLTQGEAEGLLRDRGPC